MKMPKNIQEDKSEKLGFFARRKRAIDHYVAVRKERSNDPCNESKRLYLYSFS